jgi:uncharacterized BrkB/YihY/UPF0761 family membrane protein
MPWTASPKVVELRERSAVADVVVGMLDGWRVHQSGRNASLLSAWGFLSIFPLMIVATTIVGLVLQGNEQLQQDIIDSVLADIPVLGAELAEDPTSIEGSWTVLIVGLVTALWSGTKAFVGAQLAYDDIWEVPLDERDPMPRQRGRALVGLALIGCSHIVSISLSGLVHGAEFHVVGDLLLAAGGTAIHIVVIAAMYRYLTSASPSWTDVWPGAIAAGIVYGVLQHYATALVTRITANASDTYGQFAIVLGLVTWLSFLAIATLMSAELNLSIIRRRERLAATAP